MKTTAVVTIMAVVILKASSTFSQGMAVYDVKADFNSTMNKIEQKAYKAKDWLYNLQTIKMLTQQFQRMDTMRKVAQNAYDLNNRIQDNLKKVSSLKDFGINDAAYLVEKVVQMPIDPSYYLIRAKGDKYNKFVKAVSYTPSKDLNANSKDIYNFITAYDPEYGAGEGNNKINMFDDIAKTFLFEEDWRRMVKMEEARNIANSRAGLLAEMERIKKTIEELKKDGKHPMTEAERLAALLYQQKKLADINQEIRDQNKLLGDELKKRKNDQLILTVSSEYLIRNRNLVDRMRGAKMIKNISLRKQEKGRKPISKIVYSWN